MARCMIPNGSKIFHLSFRLNLCVVSSFLFRFIKYAVNPVEDLTIVYINYNLSIYKRKGGYKYNETIN